MAVQTIPDLILIWFPIGFIALELNGSLLRAFLPALTIVTLGKAIKQNMKSAMPVQKRRRLTIGSLMHR